MKKVILKKVLIGCIIIFSIIIIILFIILMKFKNTDDLVLKNDLSCGFREEVYTEDFIKFMNGELIKNNLIDTSEVGTKTVTIDYRNQYGFVTRKEFTLKILDVTAPVIVVNNPYVVEQGNIQNIKDNIFCADDYDDHVSCKLEGSYDLSKKGNYPLTMIATDASGNQTERKFTLKVIDSSNDTTPPVVNNNYTSFTDVYQKYKKKDTMIGLDLSKWQEEVDFEKIKEQGVEFVMLKIGGQRKVNEEFSLDPKFLTNIKNALQQDLKVGVYFYSYASTTEDAIQQAKWVVKNLKDYKIELPIAFDWENWSQFTRFHISFHTLNKIAEAFFQEIEKNGYKTMLYSSKYYLETIWYHENYNNWLAYYTEQNDYQNNYSMWQLCSDGKIEGIHGYVDINVLYKK